MRWKPHDLAASDAAAPECLDRTGRALGCGESAARRVLQHSACLVKADAREQLDKLADWYTVLEILEQGGNRHARATEHPGSTDPLRVAFYSGTA